MFYEALQILELGWNSVPLVIRSIAAAIALIAAAIGLMAAMNKLSTERKRRAILDGELSQRFVKQFNKAELSRFLHGYIIPKCSPSDPANREGEGYLADLRE